MSDGFPVGAVAAFAGELYSELPTPAEAYWLVCDGAEFPLAAPEFEQLFNAIGFTYGGSSETGYFKLPDYRGQFLRGADMGSGNDPDASLRRDHRDEVPPVDGPDPSPVGANAVGSIQAAATGRPAHPFTASFPHLPATSKETAKTIFSPPEAARWSGGSRTIEANTEGGDEESRPVNIYVNFYIKARDPES